MVRRTVTLPVAPPELWPSLADPGRWLGGDMDWALTKGGPLRWEGDDGERRSGRIGEVQPEHKLSFTWWTENGDDVSEVTWTLEPTPDGTELTVEEVPVAAAGATTTAGWGAADEAAFAVYACTAALVAA